MHGVNGDLLQESVGDKTTQQVQALHGLKPPYLMPVCPSIPLRIALQAKDKARWTQRVIN